MHELEDLRHKFGDKVVRIVQNSPLLLRDLRRIYGRGVHVRRINGSNTAYSQSNTKEHPAGLICIGSLASPIDKVLFLAHEAYHILYGTTPPPDPRRISRERYVARAVREEVQALIHETKVAEELWEAGYKLAFKHMNYLAGYLRGGYQEVRSMI